jgi:type 1 glutamine amidotransferase
VCCAEARFHVCVIHNKENAMPRVALTAMLFGISATLVSSQAESADPTKPEVSEEVARAIEEAAPDEPLVQPARPRKVLVYGRVRTHAESVPPCFKAIEVLGRKTGAFETVISGDPEVFAPENLKQFDAVVMNNTHERRPMLPADFEELDDARKKAAAQREEILKQSLLDFVAGGKGIVGIHGAVAGIRWEEFLELLGGRYGGHVTESVWIKPEEPGHPLCAPLEGKSFEIHDEIYAFREPYAREKVRVLTSLDLSKTVDPKKRDDKDYPVSWVREYGKGRVFYGSLGHVASAYANPFVLRHYLAGIQFAIGDIEADATPRQEG